MLDFAELNSLTLDITFNVHGVPAVITAPTAERALSSRVIWSTPETMEVPGDSGFQRREPQKVLAVRRSIVTDAPIGTLIVAAEVPGGEVKTWRVDGTERVETEIVWVVVMDITDGCDA